MITTVKLVSMWYKQVMHAGACLARDFSLGRCLDNAALLTLTTLLSLVPLITLIYAALRLMPGMTELGGVVEDWLFEQLIPSRGEEIRLALQDFSEQASKLTIAGTTMLLAASLFMLARIEGCLNAIWQVKSANAGLSSFLRYWAVLSLGPILIGIGVFLTSYVTSIKIIGNAVELLGVQSILLSVMPFMLTVSAFTLVYVAVPNCSVPLKAALLGAVTAALLFEIAKRVFAWFITEFPSYELIYGAFAALPIFIIWLQLSWVILLFGGVVTRTFAVDVLRSAKVPDLFIGIEVLKLFDQAQSTGAALTEEQILSKLKYVSRYQLDRIREKLERKGWLVRTDDEHFLLTRTLSRVTKFEVMQLLGWINPEDVNQDFIKELNCCSSAVAAILESQELLKSKILNGSVCDWFEPNQENFKN